MRTEKLRAGLTDEERSLLDSALSLDDGVERTEEEWEQLGVIWRGSNAISSPVLLIARPVRVKDDPYIVARFAAYDLLPKREGKKSARSRGGWFLSGYVSRLPEGAFLIRQLTIEPDVFKSTPDLDVVWTNRPDPPVGSARPVSSDVLRGVESTLILAKVRAYLSEVPGALALDAQHGRAVPPTARALATEGARLADEMPEAPKRGRPGRAEAELERVARVCLDEFHERGRGWLERVVDLERRPRDTVRDQIRAARRAEFLSPGERGKSDVQPGPRLRGRWHPPRGGKTPSRV